MRASSHKFVKPNLGIRRAALNMVASLDIFDADKGLQWQQVTRQHGSCTKRRRTVVAANRVKAHDSFDEAPAVTEEELFRLLDEGLGTCERTPRFQCLSAAADDLPPISMHSDGTPCPGVSKCAFVVVNPDDHSYVCSETGLSFGQVHVDDGSGSYCKRRNDVTEEMSELPSAGRRRRDPLMASMSAFLAAKTFTDSHDIPTYVALNSRTRPPPIALPDEEVPNHMPNRTNRAEGASDLSMDLNTDSSRSIGAGAPTPKNAISRRFPRKHQLIADATAVLDEVIRVGHAMHLRHRRNLDGEAASTPLPPSSSSSSSFSYSSSSSFSSFPSSSPSSPAVQASESLAAPRGAGGLEHLMVATVRRYIKDCQGRNEPPSLHDLHSICYSLRLQADQQQISATISTSCAQRRWWYIGVRDAIARLAVSLWTNMLKTPYMRDNRRSHDGFKQFVVGVAYGLRRGVKLSSGVVLIPRCERFCSALPNMRSPRDKRSKQTPFRMSAHRGMCTFQRAAASVAENEQASFWEETTRIAQALEAAHLSNVDE